MTHIKGKKKKEKGGTQEKKRNTQSGNCIKKEDMNKSFFTYFYKRETVFGFLFKFPITD